MTAAPERFAAHRVLIADDDEFFRLALRSILIGRLGFAEVVETVSLDEALGELGQDGAASFALALFDLRMPGMESAASLGAVRECFPSVRTAIVSASRRRSDILAALDAGAHGYVWKASGAADLERAVRTIMAGEIAVPAFLADVSLDDGPVAPMRRETALKALTARQTEVLDQLAAGRSNKEIARALGLGEGTVKVHVAALLRALGASNRAAAAAAYLAERQGIGRTA